MGWWKKNNDASKNSLSSDEYERLVKKFSDYDARIRILDTQLEIFKTNLDDLRGKFNRKLKGLQAEEPKEEPKEEKKTETINNNEFVAFG